jgi:hypothetical protein
VRISARLEVLVAAWLLHGCGDSSTGEETGASTASTGGGMTTASTDTTAPAISVGETSSDGTPTTTAADSTGAPTSTGPGEGSSDAGSSDGETGGVCEPPPPAGDACLECVVANCCTAWVACQADEPCACVVDCHVVQGGSLGMCSNQCNLDSDLYQALYFCGQGSCLGTCDWDCC